MMNKKTLGSIGVACLFAGVAILIRQQIVTTRPLEERALGLSATQASSNVDKAVDQMKRLIPELRAANWNPAKVGYKRFFLPGQELLKGQSPYTRSPALAFPNMWPPQRNDYKEVAFYTDLYLSTNVAYYNDDGTKFNTKGCYLVGWKDGRVTKVPIEDARWVKGSEKRTILAFPGMTCYDPNGAKHAYVMSAQNASSKEWSQWAKTMGNDCEGGNCQQ